MSDEQKKKLEIWGSRVAITAALVTLLTLVVSAGAWAENNRLQLDGLRERVKVIESKSSDQDKALQTINRNLIRMAVKYGVPRLELEDVE